jgi:hypothetical protein
MVIALAPKIPAHRQKLLRISQAECDANNAKQAVEASTMNGEHSPALVLIEWLDSGQPVPSWRWLEHIEPRRPHLCVSVGFLMQDDAAAKVLAPNLGASNGSSEWDQASGVITIPASAVQRMVRLDAGDAAAGLTIAEVPCTVVLRAS